MNFDGLKLLARLLTTTTCFTCLILPSDVEAELTSSYTFRGRGNWSIDGADEGNSAQIAVPIGSTVSRAFLYASTALGTPAPTGVTPEVHLGSVVYDSADFEPLDFVMFPGRSTGMQAFRADATSQIRGLIGGGQPAPFDVPVTLATTTLGHVTGIILGVIYENPSEDLREIIFLDGGSIGGQFSFDLSQPVNLSNPNFESLMSVGIGFSADTFAQRTEVYIGDRLLTAGAGGSDDGADSITVGGLGDDASNPADPFVVNNLSIRDDEYYDLAMGNAIDPSPFVFNGQQVVSFSTINVGQDDNLFFAGLNIVIPEPSSGQLLLILFCACAAYGRRAATFQIRSRRVPLLARPAVRTLRRDSIAISADSQGRFPGSQ